MISQVQSRNESNVNTFTSIDNHKSQLHTNKTQYLSIEQTTQKQTYIVLASKLHACGLKMISKVQSPNAVTYIAQSIHIHQSVIVNRRFIHTKHST